MRIYLREKTNGEQCFRVVLYVLYEGASLAFVDTEEILLLDYNLPPSTNQIVSIILEDRITSLRLVYIASRGLDFLDIVKVCLDDARLNRHSIR